MKDTSNMLELQAKSYWKSVCDAPRLKQLFAFAESWGLDGKVIAGITGEDHPLWEYAMQLSCYAMAVAEEEDQEVESFHAVALLIAMEIAREDSWAPGARLVYDIEAARIPVSQAEWGALHAMIVHGLGDYREANRLFEKNKLAVAFHCGDLLTRVLSFSGKSPATSRIALPELQNRFSSNWGDSSVSTIYKIVQEFVPAYLGNDTSKVLQMVRSLEKSNKFQAPAHVREDGTCDVTLGQHICNVAHTAVSILKPQTDAEIGAYIMAALCHDLRKISDYQTVPGQRRYYHENGQLTDADGRKFDLVPLDRYVMADKMSLSHNKSLYMAIRFLPGILPEEVAAAIVTCDDDMVLNGKIEKAMYDHPLALYLHIADMVVKHLEETTI